MFDELEKYKENGHFFFQKGDNLKNVSKNVPDKPGVYYFLRLRKGKIDLVYIGKSGTMMQNGLFRNQLLKNRLNNKQGGMKRQFFLDLKLADEEIDAVDIYWFVTHNEQHHDLPAFVEGILLQRYFEMYGELPEWNSGF
ncbi:hypothetical protein [Kaistella jeonii]|uniref:GIY-YIG domain-containing protein n=1 Tax=Kaistella jeonii TaxID=266749 RepID=A0A0C1F8Y2_9FLAO|nr:hypothetical protein [Kaistella jeonii]KIA89587.1 hypothetical protein OA86_02840 [Kaistella jeonii]SFB90460.1 hypothetical protein SAMN05421876_103332 [Kaistella jeonii]VEI95795.1 Uncharacterised protein [Kaistella jeonii]